jgi:uncharacterized protein
MVFLRNYLLKCTFKMYEITDTDKWRWIETGAVVLMGALKYVFMNWLELRVFYIVAACLFWIAFIYFRYRNNRLILNYWGFRRKNFKKAFLFILPFALAVVAGVAWYGIKYNAAFLNRHILPIILVYPLWGVIQQFLILALIAGNLYAIQSVRLTKLQVILFVSVIFSLVHYPSFPLVVFTFFMELLFGLAYFRWRNLWPLGLFHGWIASLVLFFVLGRDLWSELWEIF